MCFELTMQYIVLSVGTFVIIIDYYYYYTGLLEYLLKFNYRRIIIHGQDGGGAGSFRRYGLVQAVLHDHGVVVRDFGSTWHRLGVDISAKHKKHRLTIENRNII